MPASAASAPRPPPQREPNTTAKLTMLGPGRNWQRANASLNSSALIQRRCSTTIRRAHGSTPPNAITETEAKPRKISVARAGGGVGRLADEVGGSATSSDMSED